MTQGLFISFEGSEGCGKSTQLRYLADRLQAAGRQVIVTREPGGTRVGEEIRELLQFSKASEALTPEAELLLFTASRAQLTREVIRPALLKGAVVLADRFLDSTTVYQGVARRLESEAVNFINRFAVGGTTPDMTFILDLDPDEARRRMLGRRPERDVPDRMEQQPEQFYLDVREGYRNLAATEPERFIMVNAARAEDEVASAIAQTLTERFHGIFER